MTIPKHLLRVLITVIIFVVCAFPSIGFAAITNDLSIEGKGNATAQSGIFLIDSEITDSVGADLTNSDSSLLGGCLLDFSATLSSTNINSTLTYTLTFYNSTNEYFIYRDVFSEERTNTSQLTYDIENMPKNSSVIAPGDTISCQFIVSYILDPNTTDINTTEGIVNFEFTRYINPLSNPRFTNVTTVDNISYPDDWTDITGETRWYGYNGRACKRERKKNILSKNDEDKYLYQKVSLTKNHVYYFFFHGKANLAETSGDVVVTTQEITCGIFNSSNVKLSSNSIVYTTTDKNYLKQGNKCTATATSSNYQYRLCYNSNTARVYLDDVGIVDLTLVFGAGNEPSKDWCYEHIDIYNATYISITG